MTRLSTYSTQEMINKAAAYLDLKPENILAPVDMYTYEIKQALHLTVLDPKQSQKHKYVWAAINSSAKNTKPKEKTMHHSIVASMNLATSLIPGVIGRSRFKHWIESTRSMEPAKSSALFKLVFADCWQQFMIERMDLDINLGSMLRIALYLLFSVLSLLLLALIFI